MSARSSSRAFSRMPATGRSWCRAAAASSPAVTAAGADFLPMNVARKNPLVMLRNAFALTRLVRERGCHVIHAHGRAPAWSAYWAARRTGVPFLTSWYKGFREQNAFKRLYNSVMARGDRVIAVSDQIAELINERYATPWERITVIPLGVDVERFDPAGVAPERIDAVRRAWGITPRRQGDPGRRPHAAAQGPSTSWCGPCAGSPTWGSRISAASSSARMRAARAMPANCGTSCIRPTAPT